MYVANFAKESVHDYAGFFNQPIESEEITTLRKEIQKLQKQLEESVSKLELMKNFTATDSYTPIEENLILIYEGKNATLVFDLNTGLFYDEGISNCRQITVCRKSGSFFVLTGYSYPLGAAIVKHYKYNIASNNTKVIVQTIEEILVPLAESTRTCYTIQNNKVTEEYLLSTIQDALNVNATTFIKEFYGVDKEVGFSLNTLRKYISDNASFEIILRTARSKDFGCLMSLKSEKSVPVYKLLKVTKEEYQLLIEKDCLEDFIASRKLIENHSEELEMSTMDIIHFLDNCKRWSENLEFYNIFSNCLPKTLLEFYLGIGWNGYKDFPKYYSLGKFSNYVVTETINQGYTSIGNLVNSLRDYIKMCIGVGLKPHFYTTSLELTHNVAARNYKIALTEEQEVIFKNRYAEFEPFEYEDYVLIAPRTSEDVKSEGSSLNHCVASYIKDIIDGNTQIFFLRLKKEYKNSLVTVEIRGKAVVQARGASNRDLTEKEEEVLRIFCANRKLAYKV